MELVQRVQGRGAGIDWNEYREYRGGVHGLIIMSTSRVQVRDGRE